jgi:hypothetical protein
MGGPDDPQRPPGEPVQQAMKVIGYVVIALMAAGVVYANFIGITYWAGIGV